MTYKSTHPPGAKTILLVLGLLLGPLVAACSGGTAATAVGNPTPATTSTPSFAPVDFDKDAPDFKFFDACNDLSDEDYAEIGLTSAKIEQFDPSKPSSGCSFRHIDENFSKMRFGAVSDLSTEDMVLQHTEAVTTSFDSKNEGSYFHSAARTGERGECMVSISTSGGRLGVFVYSIGGRTQSRDETCKLSDDLLYKFLRKAETKNES